MLHGSRRSWFEGRVAGAGTCAGVLGGFCCIGKAIAVGTGLGALSFFGTWMQRYQLFFILASLGMLTLWFVGLIRTYGMTGHGLLVAARSSARHGLGCLGTYVVTLAVTMGAMAAADWRCGS